MNVVIIEYKKGISSKSIVMKRTDSMIGQTRILRSMKIKYKEDLVKNPFCIMSFELNSVSSVVKAELFVLRAEPG